MSPKTDTTVTSQHSLYDKVRSFFVAEQITGHPTCCTCKDCTSYAHHTLYQFIALTYNLATCASYYGSPVEFFQHAFGQHHPEYNHRVSKLENPWDIGWFSFIVFSVTVLFISNQLTFPESIRKKFNLPKNYNGHEVENAKGASVRKTTGEKVQMTLAIYSSFYKTLVTSSSFYALMTNLIPAKSAVNPGAIIVTVLFSPGNLAAQSSVLLENILKNANFKRPVVWSLYCAFTYACCNAALYFNQVDAEPEHCHWIDNRITHHKTPAELVAFVLMLTAFIPFFIPSTTANFYRRIYTLLKKDHRAAHQGGIDNGKVSHSEKNPFPPAHSHRSEQQSTRSVNETQVLLGPDEPQNTQDITLSDKLNVWSVATALAKTIATSLSLIGIFASRGHKDVGYALAGITAVGNFCAQLTLYIDTNKNIYKQKVSNRKSCSGLFTYDTKENEHNGCCAALASVKCF